MILPEPLHNVDGNFIRWQGRRLLFFSGCDYFRLAQDRVAIASAHRMAKRFGLSVSASRLTTGHRQVYDELESALARYFNTDSALLISSGYLTNTTVAQGMVGEFTHVLIDELGHAALKDAAVQFGCPVVQFRHRDPHSLSLLASSCGKRARLIVLTDGMFSHDGSVAPLKEYLRVLPRTAKLLVDDAHGAGVLGERGRGTLEFAGVGRQQIIQTLTLSKAFGCYGGVILGSAALREKILRRSHAFIGSTPFPAPLAAAAIATVKRLANGKSIRHRLHRNADLLKEELRTAGFAIPQMPGPIVALHPSSQAQTKRLKRALLNAGIYPPFIRYGNDRQGFFRFVVSSEHTRQQLKSLVNVLRAFAPST